MRESVKEDYDVIVAGAGLAGATATLFIVGVVMYSRARLRAAKQKYSW